MTKEILAKWCGDYANDYRFTLNGELYDASCPEICEGVSNDILNCTKLEDVTDEYENYHPLMQRAVEYYDCELYNFYSGVFSFESREFLCKFAILSQILE